MKHSISSSHTHAHTRTRTHARTSCEGSKTHLSRGFPLESTKQREKVFKTVRNVFNSLGKVFNSLENVFNSLANVFNGLAERIQLPKNPDCVTQIGAST